MKPEEYQHIVFALDRALFIFHEAHDRLTDRDRALERVVSSVRGEVVRTGSGHPFTTAVIREPFAMIADRLPRATPATAPAGCAPSSSQQ